VFEVGLEEGESEVQLKRPRFRKV